MCWVCILDELLQITDNITLYWDIYANSSLILDNPLQFNTVHTELSTNMDTFYVLHIWEY